MSVTRKIKIAILFGGQSAEHEVSIRSAKNVVDALDKKKYSIRLVKIEKDGNVQPFLNILGEVDVVFPVLHGPYGEDGTVQGMLKLMNVPYVGADVLGSALGMDKDVMKRLLRAAGIPVADFLVFHRGKKLSFSAIKKKFGSPLFVKPANLGSSVGVSRVENASEFKKAVAEAFEFDNKILIEKFVKGREIECSVLGNEKPIASVPGEIIPTHAFYTYEAKYIDENGARLDIPAQLPKKVVNEVKKLAIETFKTLCLEGMARVDFFLTPQNKIIVNEVNTIPGFTAISMYPKLWKAGGMSYSELVDRLVQLALERHERDRKLKTSYLSR